MVKRTSDVWQHFTLDAETKKAKCKYCKKSLSINGGSIGNLYRHLKGKHPTLQLVRKPRAPNSNAATTQEFTPQENNETAQPKNSTHTENELQKLQNKSLESILEASEPRTPAKQKEFYFVEKASADLSKDLLNWPREKPREAYGRREERDEWSVFGELVGCKVRSLPTHFARATVQHLINNIMWEADMGKFNFPPDPTPPASSPAASRLEENQLEDETHAIKFITIPSQGNE